MSKLEFFGRPLVQFNPSIKEHRQIYYKFVEQRGWGHSPYRFIVPDDHGGDLPSMVQAKMMEYYLEKEFGARAPIPEKLVRQKKTKLVDKK